MFIFLMSALLSLHHPHAPHAPQYHWDWKYTTPPAVVAAPAPALPRKHYPESITRWHDTALAAGWTQKQWPVLECIIWHESRGVPTAGLGKHDHVGLLQLSSSGFPGVDLTDPATNFRIGHGLFMAHWWAPWMMQGGDQCVPK